MRMLRQGLVIISITALFGACLPSKDNGGNGGGSPALSDANCGSRSIQNCANTNCEINVNACVGKASYCSKYSSADSCPGSSCVWNTSCVPRTPYVPPTTQNDPNSPTTPQVVNCSIKTQVDCLAPDCTWNLNQCVNSSALPQNSGNIPQDPNLPPSSPVNPNQEIICSQIGADVWKCWNTIGCSFYPFSLPPYWGCHATR